MAKPASKINLIVSLITISELRREELENEKKFWRDIESAKLSRFRRSE